MNNTRLWSSLLLGCLSASLLVGCGGGNSTPEVKSDLPTTMDGTALTTGYKITGDNVVFFFDETQQKTALESKKITDITGIGIRGSFNGWPNPTPPEYLLHASSTNKGVWSLQLPMAKVKAPGNSGYPEFQFVINSTVDGKTGKDSYMGVPANVPAGYWFSGNGSGGNQLIITSNDDINTVINNVAFAKVIRPRSEFDLNLMADREKIANFRQVPGLSKLYRSYHPFKKSRPQLDTENDRIAQVNALMELHGIRSDITLYKDESKSLDAANGEIISPYYQKLLDGGHVYFVPSADYNTVYYGSAGANFTGWVKGVVEFINNPTSEAPFLLHCRLGNDRTGVFSAVLAAMAGTSWNDIAADYQRTNDMQIQEFRDARILKYSLEQMLGVSDISKVNNLQATVSNHFIAAGALTQAQIDAMVTKLK